ncbi:MAG: hypothetical protein WD004_01295 [Actinomycetota bacterium]
MPRKSKPPVDRTSARTIGGLLRNLRRAAGLRAVQAPADTPGCPAARQTIYAYERGGLVPSLPQFLELVEFYSLNVPSAPVEIRHQAVSAVVQGLTLPAFHVTNAMDLIARLQVPARKGA